MSAWMDQEQHNSKTPNYCSLTNHG